ncbi:hypothetical protein, partial [Craterilacuibacter sp.]|uniref:hypothetical protein n=1 Tax=Craterilacuibacter sp. TaxID=2870909 RepID=UPI003F2FE91F
ISRWHLDQVAALPRQLVILLAPEFAPALIQDRFSSALTFVSPSIQAVRRCPLLTSTYCAPSNPQHRQPLGFH